MVKERILSESQAPDDLDAKMQKVSLVISLAALGLMIGGLADMLVGGAPLTVPGDIVLPLPALVHLSHAPVSLVAMSVGIVLLALLPSVRVLLALWLYVRRRDVLDTLVALVVLLELLLSMRTG